eukprot:gene750-495_t
MNIIQFERRVAALGSFIFSFLALATATLQNSIRIPLVGFFVCGCIQAALPLSGPHFNPCVTAAMLLSHTRVTSKKHLARRLLRQFFLPQLAGCSLAVLLYGLLTLHFPAYPGEDRRLTAPSFMHFDARAPLESEFCHVFLIVLAHLFLLVRVHGRGYQFASLIITVAYLFGFINSQNASGAVLSPALAVPLCISGVVEAAFFPGKNQSIWQWVVGVKSPGVLGIFGNTVAYIAAHLAATALAVLVFRLIYTAWTVMRRTRAMRQRVYSDSGFARSPKRKIN